MHRSFGVLCGNRRDEELEPMQEGGLEVLERDSREEEEEGEGEKAAVLR